MRHGVFGRKLGRDIKSRKALLNNLASSLLEQGKITTTLAKAKFAKPFVDKLITKAKKNALHRQRVISSMLTPKAFAKLINEIAPGFTARASGYTSITRLAQRRGDNAPMVRLELLEWDKSRAKTKKPVTTVGTKERKKLREIKSKKSKSVKSVVARKK